MQHVESEDLSVASPEPDNTKCNIDIHDGYQPNLRQVALSLLPQEIEKKTSLSRSLKSESPFKMPICFSLPVFLILRYHSESIVQGCKASCFKSNIQLLLDNFASVRLLCVGGLPGYARHTEPEITLHRMEKTPLQIARNWIYAFGQDITNLRRQREEEEYKTICFDPSSFSSSSSGLC